MADPGERPGGGEGGLFLDQTEAEGSKKHFLNNRSIKMGHGYLRTFLILKDCKEHVARVKGGGKTLVTRHFFLKTPLL